MGQLTVILNFSNEVAVIMNTTIGLFVHKVDNVVVYCQNGGQFQLTPEINDM